MPIYNREDNLSPEEEQVLAEQRRLKAQSDSDPEELTFQERWIVMRLFRRVALVSGVIVGLLTYPTLYALILFINTPDGYRSESNKMEAIFTVEIVAIILASITAVVYARQADKIEAEIMLQKYG